MVIKVAMAGVCGTDLHILEGKRPDSRYPMIPGHEIVGWVVEADPLCRDPFGDSFAPGDRVLVFLSVFCGHCRACLRKEPNLCDNRLIYGIAPFVCSEPPHFRGGYAEYLYVLPGSTVFHIPNAVTFEAAVSAGCAGGTAMHAHRKVALLPGDLVVVLGAGPVGLYCAAIAQERGATVVVADVAEGRLRVAKRFCRFTVDAASVTQTVKDMSDGHGADVVFSCTGNPRAFPTCLLLIRRGGIVVEVGYGADVGEVSFNPYRMLTHREARIFGSWSLEAYDVWRVLEFLGQGIYPFAELVTRKVPLVHASEALSAARSGTEGKVVIVPTDSE
ncbi:MAG: alcohol dehydrogenase catalytic domain-containing protein [Bacillota bacterium]